MIPVSPQDEPPDFHAKVRVPGQAYLAKTPSPTSQQFKDHAFWTLVSGELRTAYRGICAYSCHFVPHDVGWTTTEHYKPKDLFPNEAYEWLNYRFVSGGLNRNKGTKQILDPFLLAPQSFVLSFPDLHIKVGPGILPEHMGLADNTITFLKLNNEGESLTARQDYLTAYCEKGVPFDYIKERAPFIASELERQGLVERIFEMWISR